MAGTPRPLGRRIASGFGAAVLADLILGMGAFSVITLASLWYFSLGWLQLAREYAAVGRVFGTTGEVGLAWLGAIAALPLLVVVLFLTERALRLPVRVYRGGPLPGAAGLRRWAAAPSEHAAERPSSRSRPPRAPRRPRHAGRTTRRPGGRAPRG